MKASDLTRRQATRMLEGVSFPVFTRNADYYLADLTVFEDGVLEISDVFDLEMLEDRVKRGQIAVSLPVGEWVRLGDSGSFEVGEAAWSLTPDALILRVHELLLELNPTLENLVDFQGTATTVIDGRLQWKQDRSRSRPRHEEAGAEGAAAKSMWVFERSKTGVELVRLVLFQNGCVTLAGSAGQRVTTQPKIEADALNGRFDFPDKGESIEINGLGTVTCAYPVPGWVSGKGLIDALRECARELRGEPTSYELCRQAADAYWTDPTMETLENLRTAYEAVPAYLRKYCGDMDEKDIPIRIALYGDAEIENWSHRQAARAQGLPLPGIKVPKPKDA